MGLNKSKGNMYEWITHTWNPLAGQCLHNCSYCSTNKLRKYPAIQNKYSGEPRLQECEFNTNLGYSNFIFVAAQNDLFANDIPREFILTVINHCKKYDANSYLFQTKNPVRIIEFVDELMILDFRVCTTIETNRFYPEIMGNTVKPEYRGYAMNDIEYWFCMGFPNKKLYVTIEPIIDFDIKEFSRIIEDCLPYQVNIGADSGNNGLPEPSKEKIEALIAELETFTKVKLKSNLNRLLK